MAEEMKARMDAVKNAAIEDPEFYTPERWFTRAGATMVAPRTGKEMEIKRKSKWNGHETEIEWKRNETEIEW